MKIDLSGLKVLVVDDEPDITELLSDDLRAHGATVEIANNGVDGLVAYSQFQPDVILSDVRMPGGDGIELLSKIRARGGGQPPHYFIMSGFSGISREHLLALGAQGFIEKPFRMKEIRVLLYSFRSAAAE